MPGDEVGLIRTHIKNILRASDVFGLKTAVYVILYRFFKINCQTATFMLNLKKIITLNSIILRSPAMKISDVIICHPTVTK